MPMMMMMMNCLSGIVARWKMISLISSQGHCHRLSSLQISDTPRAEFEPVQNLCAGLAESSCVVVSTTTPRRFSMMK